MLESGDSFPEFRLQDQHGSTVTKKDLLGSPVVVYFYPKDDTSGCTVEACEFRDRLSEVPGAHVVGVSPDTPTSHKKFAEKYGLGFPLLADVEKELCTACGVWVEKSMYGKKYMGVERTTFVLDSEGKVATVFRKVKPAGHAAEVLASLRG